MLPALNPPPADRKPPPLVLGALGLNVGRGEGLYVGRGAGVNVGRGAGLYVRAGELHTGAVVRTGPPFVNAGRVGWYVRPVVTGCAAVRGGT